MHIRFEFRAASLTKINNSFWVHSIDFRLKGPKISLKQPLPDDAGKNPANIQNVCINLKLRIRLQFSSRKTFFFSVFKQTFFCCFPSSCLEFSVRFYVSNQVFRWWWWRNFWILLFVSLRFNFFAYRSM